MTTDQELTFTPLFNGTDLTGWTQIPRSYGDLWPGGPHVLEAMTLFPRDYQEHADAHPAVWTVEDGVVVGRQNPPGSGYGGYLLSDESYGDFELIVEAKPDWPADTGIMLRRSADSWEGVQVLIDHRRSGSIGGFFGNGLGSFHAVPFALDAVVDADGAPVGLRGDDPATSVEPFSPAKRELLTEAADLDEFLTAWKWDDWNEFRIRCVGEIPEITVWINGLLVSKIDLAALDAPNYDAPAIWSMLGTEGRIAFEVHDNDPAPGMAEDRWGTGAACRWRNARIARL
jgi:hypothetical protein